jgi:hypothetical protein
MPCAKIRLADAGKYRKKYPHVRNIPRYVYASQKTLEIQSMFVDIADSDVVTFTFSEPFTGTPSVVANILIYDSVGAVNVYVETASATGATIRTSAPTTGKITVHAMYAEGCDAVDY